MAKASFNEPNPIPNITGWHDVPNLTNIERKNLESVLDDDDKNSIQIYLRLRPNIKEQTGDNFKVIDSRTIEVKAPPDSCISKANRSGCSDEARYIFSQVFEPHTSQKVLFNSCVLNPVHKFIDGKSCLIFSYGTSNAGKTHTIHGTKRDPGIIPRVLSILFKSIKEKQCSESQGLKFRPEFGNSVKELDEDDIREQIALKEKILNVPNDASGTDLFQSAVTHQTDSSYAYLSSAPSEFSQMEELIDEEIVSVENEGDVLYSVWVSFLEIYNEQVYDLLVPQSSSSEKRVPLKIATDHSRNVFVKGLNHVHVTSGIEAYKVLLVGKNNLQVASTNLNRSSSRSHCVFSVKLIKRENVPYPSEAILSSFSICDLAGAERLEKTGNTGSRMKETQNINTSLHVLVRCFKTMLENQSRPSKPEVVPYRDSKLTQLFHRQLCGKFNEDVIMIVNVNPSPKLFEETSFVLKASAIAKQIVRKPVKPKINKRKSVFSTLVFENQNRNTIPWEAVEEERLEPVTIDLDQLYADFEAEKQKIREECEVERLRCVTALDNMMQEMTVEHNEHLEQSRELLIQERIRREGLFRNVIHKLRAEIAELKGEQNGSAASSGSDLNEKLQNAEELESVLEKVNQEKIELKSEITVLKQENSELRERIRILEKESDKATISEKELKKSEQNIIKLKQLLDEARTDLLDTESEKCALKEEILKKEEELDDLEGEIKELKKLISSKTEILELAEVEIEQKDDLIHKLRKEVEGKDITIDSLHNEVEELKELNETNVCKHDRLLNSIEKERDSERKKSAELEERIKELKEEHENYSQQVESQIAELKEQLEQYESRNRGNNKKTAKKPTSQWLGDEFKENEPVYEAKTEPRRRLRTRNQGKTEETKSPNGRRRSRSIGDRVHFADLNSVRGTPPKTPRSNSCVDLDKNLSKSSRKKLFNHNEFLDQENQIEPIKFHSLIVSSPKSELKCVKRRLRNQLK